MCFWSKLDALQTCPRLAPSLFQAAAKHQCSGLWQRSGWMWGCRDSSAGENFASQCHTGSRLRLPFDFPAQGEQKQLLPRRRCCFAREQWPAVQEKPDAVSWASLLSQSVALCLLLSAWHHSSSLPSNVSPYLCLKEDQKDAFWKCHVIYFDCISRQGNHTGKGHTSALINRSLLSSLSPAALLQLWETPSDCSQFASLAFAEPGVIPQTSYLEN